MITDTANLTTSSNGEARISLTNRCNYNCSFCHNEGVSSKAAGRQSSSAELKRVLDKLVEHGCRDICFTGGEPLLEKDLLLDLLAHLRSEDPELPVTVVTNGSMLDNGLVRDISEFQPIRFNISLHACNDDAYKKVTGQDHISIRDLEDRLKTLREGNLPFKLNCVALRSTLSCRSSVEELCRFARRTGAQSLKIIELLIVEQNEHLFYEHQSLETVEKMLPEYFKMSRAVSRGKIFTDNRNRFSVELRKCRCHYGCSECIRSQQTQMFNGKGEYCPCFACADDPIPTDEFEEALKDGKRILRRMVSKYGNNSPSLIRQVEMVPGKQEALFRARDKEQLAQFISAIGAKDDSRLHYNDIFFRENKEQPTGDPCLHRGQIVHIREHVNNRENARLVISSIESREHGGIHTQKVEYLFPDKFPIVGPLAVLERILNALGWVRSFSSEVEQKDYSTEEGGQFSILEMDEEQIVNLQMQTEQDKILAMRMREEFESIPGGIYGIFEDLRP